jgi:hypothetical protein
LHKKSGVNETQPACGAGDSIKLGGKRSGTPGLVNRKRIRACGAGDSGLLHSMAVAHFAGLNYKGH